MTEKINIGLALSKITQDMLIVPEYNGKFAYTDIRAQTATLCDRFTELQRELARLGQKILVPVEKHYKVIPANITDRYIVQNLGTSADGCLEVLHETPELRNETLVSFLKAVMVQASAYCDQIAETQGRFEAKSEAAFNERFQEYVNDIEKRQASIHRSLIAARDLLSQIQKENEKAQEVSSIAKQAADDVKKETEGLTDAVNQATTAATMAGEEAKHAENRAREAKTTAESMVPNMLAVLGIFVGVVVAVVACYLSVILTEHRGVPEGWIYSRPMDFMKILLLGHIVLTTVFLLMYLVGKLTSKTISNECRHCEPQDDDGKGSTTASRCRTCKKRCRAPVRFVHRYPYIFSINLVFFVGYVILAIWQAVNIYYREPFDDAMKKLGLRQFVFVLVGIVVAIVLVCLVTYCIRKLIKWIRNKKAA